MPVTPGFRFAPSRLQEALSRNTCPISGAWERETPGACGAHPFYLDLAVDTWLASLGGEAGLDEATLQQLLSELLGGD